MVPGEKRTAFMDDRPHRPADPQETQVVKLTG